MTTVHTKLGSGGRIVIPAAHRKALGLNEGDELLVRIEDGELRIVSQDRALQRLQAAVARHVRPGDLPRSG